MKAGFQGGWVAVVVVASGFAMAQSVPLGGPADGKAALAHGEFARAKGIYQEYLKSHADSVPGEMGLADAELGLHEYEAAEVAYRAVTAQQPELWIAHKNLVLIEAELGRWEEFDRERALLRAARERGAAGISARESDVIDSFTVPASKGRPSKRWIVREYFEPVGRSQTRYNFEYFSPEGKAVEYISLESATAAQDATVGGGVPIGAEPSPVESTPTKEFALNWYTGTAHGTIKRYPDGEPSYQVARAAVLRWLRIESF